MSRHLLGYLSAGFVFVGCVGAFGQSSSKPLADYLPITARWGRLSSKVSSLGDRVMKPGKERLVLTGTLTEGSKTSTAVVVTVQLPGLVQIERAGKAKVGYDGATATSAAGKLEVIEEDLLETFLHDAQETFLRAKLEGTQTVVFGERFRIDGKTEGIYVLPYYDVYEQTIPVKSKKAAPRTKIFLFNSSTNLLEFVRYSDFSTTPPTKIECQWTWGKSGTEVVPVKITRRENAAIVWELVITNSAVLGKVAAITFRP